MYNQISIRRSVRTFSKVPFNHVDIKLIEDRLENLHKQEAPFGSNVFLELLNQASGENEKIGTYGFVQNAAAFLAGTTPNNLESIIDYGFIGQLAVLQLLELGIGSVWLGGTFNRNTVKRSLKTDDLIPALIAIGHPKDKSLTEQTIRLLVRASSRKDFGELFSDAQGRPLDNSHKYAQVLEALRLAPSGTNRQPWRVVVDDKKMSLFIQRTPNYAKELNYDVQGLDMGIALAHLKIALDHFSIKFKIEVNKKIDYSLERILIADIIIE
jgi:nitroreductase